MNLRVFTYVQMHVELKIFFVEVDDDLEVEPSFLGPPNMDFARRDEKRATLAGAFLGHQRGIS